MHNNPHINAGTIFPPTLVASALIGLMTIGGLWLLPLITSVTSMTINPQALTSEINTAFTISIDVQTPSSVNAFAGTLHFNESVVSVADISYNTSIADLWAEKPWYDAGAGTISFAGGSTKPGGFTGTGSLLTITFTAVKPGNAELQLRDIQILQHDGFGTELPVESPVDSFFTVAKDTLPRTTPPVSAAISIKEPGLITDLSGDGKTSLGDISIFLLYLATNDIRGDINRDGAVTTTDLSILLTNRN